MVLDGLGAEKELQYINIPQRILFSLTLLFSTSKNGYKNNRQCFSTQMAHGRIYGRKVGGGGRGEEGED